MLKKTVFKRWRCINNVFLKNTLFSSPSVADFLLGYSASVQGRGKIVMENL